jgi:predicted patatin/cPLA2 family phospholipase
MKIQILLYLSLVTGCRILSLSGGGAHGAYQAGVINRLHDEGHQWDIITGISVGSLNGMMLGMFNQSRQKDAVTLLKNVWHTITAYDVYAYNWNPISSQSFLDSSPLNKTINNYAIKYGGIAQRKIILGAVSLNTGRLKLFHREDLNSSHRSSQIIMASSAIPVVFPPVLLDGTYYVDGGMYSNELIRPAIKYCLNRGFVKTEIIIDTIICSPPIDDITSKEIYSDTIFGLMSRGYNILSNVITNRELYTECGLNQEAYPMYVYKPSYPYPGGILDFSSPILTKTYEMGYNDNNKTISKYCY